MESNNFSSFTISQPFLGAPLQFQPALGSAELEQLIDAFVTGSSSKQDKLSEVTIDFFNNATVDLNTGALVRRYDVLLSPAPWAYEESPTISQSSGFSPPIFTPSPASSATGTFADSGYGSISMTPPTRGRGGVKKARKETKKAAEVRLPGFSIMTKDGVDVTSSAGRGTKTKEQREHAHLMRIMKACDDCKRKKIRCDPSHRRSHNDMSRTSTSITKSSSRQKTSPPASIPSLPHENSYASQESLQPFSTSAIDDFVLFPGDNSGWNSADMSLPDFDIQGTDLTHFNFDLDLDLNACPASSLNVDQDFDFSAFDSQASYTPIVADQYGHDQWASAYGGLDVSHTRPHPSSSTQDSGQLDTSFFSGGSQLSDSPVSPGTVPAPQGVPNDSLQSIPTPQLSSSGTSPTSDWSAYSSASFANAAIHANQDLSAPAEGGRQLGSDESLTAVQSQQSSPAGSVPGLSSAPPGDSYGHSPARWSSSPGLTSSPSNISYAGIPSEDQLVPLSTELSCMQSRSHRLEQFYAATAEASQVFQGTPARDQSLTREIIRLRETIDQVRNSQEATVLPEATSSVLGDLTSGLQILSTTLAQSLQSSGTIARQRFDQLDPETRQAYVRQSQVAARRLVRSICATINSLQAQDQSSPSSSPTSNTAVLTSGRNIQLYTSQSQRHSNALDYVQVYSDSDSGYETGDSQSPTQGSTRHSVVRLDSAFDANVAGLFDELDQYGNSSGFSHDVAVTQKPSWFSSILLNKVDYARQTSVADALASVASPMIQQVDQLSSGSIGHQSQVISIGNSHVNLVVDDLKATLSAIDTLLRHHQPSLISSTSPMNLVDQLAEKHHGDIVLSRTGGSSRDVPLLQSRGSLLRGAIPRTVPEQDNSPSTPELCSQLLDTEPYIRDYGMQYRMVQALASSASLVILNNLQVNSSGLLPYLLAVAIPLLTLAFPRFFTPVTVSLIAASVLSVCFVGMNSLRDVGTQWIGDDILPAMAKLFLCGCIAAQSPSALWKNSSLLSSLASMSLLRFSTGARSTKSSSQKPPSRMTHGKEIASMFDILCPTVHVV